MLKNLMRKYSGRARARRAELLRQLIRLEPGHRILDLGGGDGSHIHNVFPEHRNVVVADVLERDLERAREKFGYETVRLTDDATSLPFEDRAFDFVFCNSVIEHVTGPKDKIAWTEDGDLFETEGRKHQWMFAGEIRRIAERYYVQTPYRYFLFESHSWLPIFIVFLPRAWLVRLLRFTNRFWPKKTAPDWRLLTIREFSEMFPDATVHRERPLGFVKSLMAIKNQ